MKTYKFLIIGLFTACLFSCSKSPLEQINYKSDERAIEIFRIPGQVGKTEIIRSVDESIVNIQVLEDDVDLSSVTPEIMVSLGATVKPSSGETVDFKSNGNKLEYVVTSESGKERVWTVNIKPFVVPEWMNKKMTFYSPGTSGGNLVDYTVVGDMAGNYPGQNPLGQLTDQFDEKGIMVFISTPDNANRYSRPLSFYKYASIFTSIIKEYDNTVEFIFEGLNENATKVLGTVRYEAGKDGEFAQFPMVTYIGEMTPKPVEIDYAKLYRKINPGESKFEYNLITSVMSFFDAAGNKYAETSTRGTVLDNTGKLVIHIDNALTYDNVNKTLQLRFHNTSLPNLPGKYTDYNKTFDDFKSNLPYVDLSSAKANPVLYYQLRSAEEVWYDLKFVEE